MKTNKRIPRKYIDLGTFEQLFKEFLSIPTWTKEKYATRDAFYEYLESKMVTVYASRDTPNTTTVLTSTLLPFCGYR